MKYDKLIPHRFSDHARLWNIAMLKAQRLTIKNARRALHGLPPKKTYAEV